MADVTRRPTPEGFPELRFSRRSRELGEYKRIDETRIPLVIHSYLADGMTFRSIDDVCLDIFNRYPGVPNHGYKSNSICSYFGLWKEWKGFFKGMSSILVLADMQKLIAFEDDNVYSSRLAELYGYLLEYYKTSEWMDAGESVTIPERASKDWISSVILKDQAEEDYNERLRLLSGHKEYKLVLDSTERCYSSGVLKEAIKDLYDFRCQVCDSVIYKTGWKPSLPRKAKWEYLSADVHHIHPLSSKGPDVSENMVCLCPSCHRKFHTGELRLARHNGSLICKDEMTGASGKIRLLHTIDLSL